MAVRVTWEQALAWRMQRQLLDPLGDGAVPDVVRRLCGVPAQVALSAELAIRLRQEASAPGEVAEALATGQVIKIWAMRGTLHLLTPDVAGAFLSLLAAGRSWERPSWERYFGMTAKDWALLRPAVREAQRLHRRHLHEPRPESLSASRLVGAGGRSAGPCRDPRPRPEQLPSRPRDPSPGGHASPAWVLGPARRPPRPRRFAGRRRPLRERHRGVPRRPGSVGLARQRTRADARPHRPRRGVDGCRRRDHRRGGGAACGCALGGQCLRIDPVDRSRRGPRQGYPDLLFDAAVAVGRLSRNPDTEIARMAGRPLFIVHGGSDQRINVHHAWDLAAAAAAGGTPVEPWIVPAAHHSEAAFVDPAAYEARLVAFFERALSRPDPCLPGPLARLVRPS